MESMESILADRTPSPLLIASNRLPILLRLGGDGELHHEAGSGGLVRAMEPVLRRTGGTWVGWPGVLDGDVADLKASVERESVTHAYEVEPVALTARERRDFYLGFSNEILWPLFHCQLDRCRFEPRYWEAYRRVNRKFAEGIGRVARPGQFVWVHDYHLMAVGEELRLAGCDNRTGFFLHIPFPPPDIFEQLPWAHSVLHSLLRFDHVGFQTARDKRNFLECVRVLRPHEYRAYGDLVLSRWRPEHPTRVGVHPISIDTALFHDAAHTDLVRARAEALRDKIGCETVLLGVDRLDYTKGIPEKLRGLYRALEKYPGLQGRVTLVQLVIPSRVSIPQYSHMKTRIERLVGRINGRFTRGGWSPILYQFGSWSHTELLAAYRAADVALVTSLKDGMNLVSKEYVAASVERGTLVLSEFAGSVDELRCGALTVNPHHVDAMADAIHDAVNLLPEERRERLRAMQARVLEHDIHAWVRGFLERSARDPESEGEARRLAGAWLASSASGPALLPGSARHGRPSGRPRPRSRPAPETLPARGPSTSHPS